uniref:Uncharacterized protein n=1 Tax=Sipha flava TaxID=143950 RepID=A0A2S2PX97_9HEMI
MVVDDANNRHDRAAVTHLSPSVSRSVYTSHERLRTTFFRYLVTTVIIRTCGFLYICFFGCFFIAFIHNKRLFYIINIVVYLPVVVHRYSFSLLEVVVLSTNTRTPQ